MFESDSRISDTRKLAQILTDFEADRLLKQTKNVADDYFISMYRAQSPREETGWYV